MGLPIRLGLPVLLCGFALAQSQPDVKGILEKVSDTYKAASEYEIVMDMIRTKSGAGKPEATHQLVAVKPPDRYRVESPDRTDQDGKNVKGLLIVLDGATLWFYDPSSNRYNFFPATAIGTDIPDELEASGIDYATMSRFREASKNAVAASFLRVEEVAIGGAKVVCDVVSLRQGNSQFIWWVNRTNSHVVREDTQDEGDNISTTFATVTLRGPLPDGLFAFAPPAGAQKGVPDRR
jgi:outer membrane lipoprotein-sorting protein